MSGDGFPPMEDMLKDLAKVEGLASWFTLIAAALNASPCNCLTDGERKAIDRIAEGPK